MTVLKKNSDFDSLPNVAADDSVNIRDVSDTTNQATGKTKRITQRNLIRWVKGADIASAAALSPGADGNAFDVTGTIAITSINTIGIGALILLHFDGILTLTHHATDLVLPNGNNITTVAGGEGMLYEYDVGKWRCINYSPVFMGANTAIVSINLTDGQIAFPATAVPSADPNTMDDYEEGEFDVALTAGTSGTITVSASVNRLAYTKNGRVVTIQGYTQISSVSSPIGNLNLTNLPFTVANLAEVAEQAAIFIVPYNLTGAVGYITGRVLTSSTTIRMEEFTGTTLVPCADHCQVNTSFYVGGSYIAV